MGTWVYSGSMPSVPGNYHARLLIKRLYGDAPPETLDFPEPTIVALEETAAPLRSGYVFNRDNDLWIMSSDTSRERRLTFYGGTGAAASNPRWAPGGERIAFTLLPVLSASELPRTEIWALKSDGTGLEKLVAPGPEETLSVPAWTEGGSALYFSVDRMSSESLPVGTTLEEMGSFRRVDRIDRGSSSREQVYTGAQRPATDPMGKDLVYIEDVPPADLGGTPREQLIYLPDGGESMVLVKPGTFPKIQSPAISPDGKWVAFATFDPVAPEKGGYDFIDWLLFKPKTARAHDAPWDIYLVETKPNAQPVRMTNLGEDEPSTVWLDNQTLSIMGARALYRVNIDARGRAIGEPLPIREGVDHAEITWIAP
jgi:dipeptidyl aminopeptidase/acylaminoacyl peptidase